MQRLIFLIFIAVISANVFAQNFTNIRAKKEAEKVVIRYDFKTDQPEQTFNVRLECSSDGGKTFNIFPQWVSGDLMKVSAGAEKTIIWEMQKESPDLSGDQLVFQLVAVQNIPEVPKPENTGTFTDGRDGHVYKYVKIGSQTWMAENLAFLPSVSPSGEGDQREPFCYVYGYNGNNIAEVRATENYKTFGVLYNWTAALKYCPVGWHLPSDEEWKQLEITLGICWEQANSTGTRGAENGAKLKSQEGWFKSGNGTNASNFSALPGGGRYGDGNFGNIGASGFWWSSSQFGSAFAWGRGLGCDGQGIQKGVNNMEGGFSVRCIKD